jgi:REP element-mobilizing transposase RayT
MLSEFLEFGKEQPIRKNPQLNGYDYSRDGYYFVTICTKNGSEILGNVGRDALGAPCVRLSEYGVVIAEEIEKTPLYYENITIPKYVITPNHVHLIIAIISADGAPRASRPTIPSIVGVLKRKTNKAYGFDMWQRSYHDRIIRDKAEYKRIWKYIDENPANWDSDEYSTRGLL